MQISELENHKVLMHKRFQMRIVQCDILNSIVSHIFVIYLMMLCDTIVFIIVCIANEVVIFVTQPFGSRQISDMWIQ